MPQRFSPSHRHEHTREGWLILTHQIWKLYVALLGFGATLLCFLTGGILLMVEPGWFGALIAGGTFLGITTFVWFCTTLRCPSCRISLGWTMIRTRSHTSWLVDLAHLEACPSCACRLTQPLKAIR